MTKTSNPHRLAGTAIAAFLALSSTTVWAQEAPAPSDATVSAPVAQPASAIVLPPVAVQLAPAPAIATAPVVDEAPAPRAAAPRAATRTAAARPVAAPVGRTAAVSAAPVTREVTAPIADVAPVAEADPLRSDIAAPPVATAEPASQDTSNDLLLASLAGALGLGAIGVFAATRRRKVARDEPLVEYEPVGEPVRPVAESPQRYATLAAPAFTPLKSWSEPRVPQTQPVDSRALNLNREALLDRMVAAQPDANNPFTSGKARRKRARLMLQSLDSQRWDDAELEPGFDWREIAQAVERRETSDA